MKVLQLETIYLMVSETKITDSKRLQERDRGTIELSNQAGLQSVLGSNDVTVCDRGAKVHPAGTRARQESHEAQALIIINPVGLIHLSDSGRNDLGSVSHQAFWVQCIMSSMWCLSLTK